MNYFNSLTLAQVQVFTAAFKRLYGFEPLLNDFPLPNDFGHELRRIKAQCAAKPLV